MVTQYSESIRPQTLVILHEEGQACMSDHEHVKVHVTFKGELAQARSLIVLLFLFESFGKYLLNVLDCACAQYPWIQWSRPYLFVSIRISAYGRLLVLDLLTDS